MVVDELGAFKETRYKGKTLDVLSGDVGGDVEVRPSWVWPPSYLTRSYVFTHLYQDLEVRFPSALHTVSPDKQHKLSAYGQHSLRWSVSSLQLLDKLNLAKQPYSPNCEIPNVLNPNLKFLILNGMQVFESLKNSEIWNSFEFNHCRQSVRNLCPLW